jgi:hypothetical protein
MNAKLQLILGLIAVLGLAGFTFAVAHEGHEGGGEAKEVTLKGEVIDMACYVDHGATGEKHANCARKCIGMGLPVGIKTADGKVYMVIGDHEPMNNDLAELASKTVTLKGKLVSRDGINLLENAELVK